MITGLKAAIKQFTNQLKSEANVVGTLTIIWLDAERENYQLDNITSLEHEYNAKDGSLILKGNRNVNERDKQAGYFIITKLKYIYSINLIINDKKEDYEVFSSKNY
ncbi:MAG: hypothetical protein HeimC3_22200 [Candidatus Heimdallarchaeota archaeon LC_3]|nr:MAG: hypothetical protein HeimC3_22200 [Candidatus Heimdallarchaeota archaeon LC_3]